MGGECCFPPTKHRTPFSTDKKKTSARLSAFLLLELVPLLPPLSSAKPGKGGGMRKNMTGDTGCPPSWGPEVQHLTPGWDRHPAYLNMAKEPAMPNHLSCYSVALPLCPEGRDSPTVSTTCWWYQPVWRKETLKENFKSRVFDIEWPLQLKRGGVWRNGTEMLHETERDGDRKMHRGDMPVDHIRGCPRTPKRATEEEKRLDPGRTNWIQKIQNAMFQTESATTLLQTAQPSFHQPTQRGWCIDAFSEEKEFDD